MMLLSIKNYRYGKIYFLLHNSKLFGEALYRIMTLNNYQSKGV